MKPKVTLVISSLLSIVLTTFHLTDDIVRGVSPGGIVNLAVVLVLVVWLYATLELAGRRSGSVIIFVASLLASGLPVVHMMGSGGITGGAATDASGAFFFGWTLLALEVSAIFAVVLAARSFWILHRGQAR